MAPNCWGINNGLRYECCLFQAHGGGSRRGRSESCWPVQICPEPAPGDRTSLTRLIEEGLQLRLRTKTGHAVRVRRQLPVFKGRGGLVASVDASSNKAMLAALDDDA